jgi:predicted nucleic acid-binding protein
MIIFDASTLILITKIELLEALLGSVSMEAAIPREVHRACCGSKKTLDSLVIQKAVDDSRIRVVAVKNRKLADRLRDDFGLGSGEAEAIALALQTSALLVGMDDKNGINACKLLGISFTTAAGVLILCRQRNLISLDDALLRLDRLASYGRYKISIVADIRVRLEVGT